MSQRACDEDPTLAREMERIPEAALKWIVAPQWRVDPGLPIPEIRARILEAAATLGGPARGPGGRPQPGGPPEMLAGLDANALRLLWVALAAEAPVPVDALAEAFAGGAAWRWSQLVQPLRCRLLVAPAGSVHGQPALRVPRELREPLRRALGVPQEASPAPEGPAQLVPQDPVARLAWAVAFVATRGSVRVTQRGEVHRVDVRRLAELLHGDEEEPSEEAMEEAEGLLKLARRLGVLRSPSGTSLEPSWEHWHRLLARTREEVLAALLAALLPLSDPGQARWARAALEALSTLEPGHWYRLDPALARLSAASARAAGERAFLSPEGLGALAAGPLATLGLVVLDAPSARPALPLGLRRCPDCGGAHRGDGDPGPWEDADPADEDEDDEAEAWDDQREASAVRSTTRAAGPRPAARDAAPGPRFCVSPRLRGMVEALRGAPPPSDAQPAPCLVINPDFEAILLDPEPEPAVFAALARIAAPQPPRPVWRVLREAPRSPEQDAGSHDPLAHLAPHLRAPLPGNVERVLRERLAPGRATRLRAALLVEGPDVQELLRDPVVGALLEPLAPGVARVRGTALGEAPRLAARLGYAAAPPWTNARLLAQLAGEDRAPAPPDVERAYGPGGRRLAEDLGLRSSPAEEQTPDVDALLREARSWLSGAPSKARKPGPWGATLELPRPPALRGREEETLLACHQALLRSAPLSAQVRVREPWVRDAPQRDRFHVHSILTTPRGAEVELSRRGQGPRYRVSVGDIALLPAGAEPRPSAPEPGPRHSWRRARGGR